jgi:hypothetical protein
MCSRVFRSKDGLLNHIETTHLQVKSPATPSTTSRRRSAETLKTPNNNKTNTNDNNIPSPNNNNKPSPNYNNRPSPSYKNKPSPSSYYNKSSPNNSNNSNVKNVDKFVQSKGDFSWPDCKEKRLNKSDSSLELRNSTLKSKMKLNFSNKKEKEDDDSDDDDVIEILDEIEVKNDLQFSNKSFQGKSREHNDKLNLQTSSNERVKSQILKNEKQGFQATNDDIIEVESKKEIIPTTFNNDTPIHQALKNENATNPTSNNDTPIHQAFKNENATNPPSNNATSIHQRLKNENATNPTSSNEKLIHLTFNNENVSIKPTFNNENVSIKPTFNNENVSIKPTFNTENLIDQTFEDPQKFIQHTPTNEVIIPETFKEENATNIILNQEKLIHPAFKNETVFGSNSNDENIIHQAIQNENGSIDQTSNGESLIHQPLKEEKNVSDSFVYVDIAKIMGRNIFESVDTNNSLKTILNNSEEFNNSRIKDESGSNQNDSSSNQFESGSNQTEPSLFIQNCQTVSNETFHSFNDEDEEMIVLDDDEDQDDANDDVKMVKSFKISSEMKQQKHLARQEKFKEMRTKRQKSNQCNICKKQLSTPMSLESHIQNIHHNGKSWKCSLCPKSFTTKYIMTNHILNVHEKKKPFYCKICGKTFRAKSFMVDHILAEHKTDQKNIVIEID